MPKRKSKRVVEDELDGDDLDSIDSARAGCYPPSSPSSSELSYSDDSADEAKPSSTRKSSSKEKSKKVATTRTRRGEVNDAGGGSLYGLNIRRDFSDVLVLKDDHEDRPLWVTPDCVVYLERKTRFYFHAYEFLSTVGEPVSRSEHLHEWVLTKTSLHAASSVEMTPKGIIEELEKLSKVRVPEEVKTFIKQCADSYGKVKIVLRKGDIFVESLRVDLLRRLLAESEVIRAARIYKPKPQQFPTSGPASTSATTIDLVQAIQDASKDEYAEDHDAVELSDNVVDDGREEGENGESPRARHFQINPDQLEAVKQAAQQLDLPLMDEFDYNFDVSTPRLKANLKHTTKIRPYQQKCLSKMFGNSRAKSGVFVLPCGAGKTLTAITAVCTMQRSAMILCSSTVAVEQWKRQFHLFAEIGDGAICRFTSKAKDEIKDDKDEEGRFTGFVLITTYYMMLSNTNKKKAKKPREDATENEKLLDKLLNREWGMLILDEVHMTPANSFRTIVNRVKAHCKLGLTATLVREDELIQDLTYLIGPKLYEADWMDLTEQGYLARVSCQEIRCPMTEQFMAEYLRARDSRGGKSSNLQLQQLLIAVNPNKFRSCEFLMHLHEQKGDKILIFCDNIQAVEYYAAVLNREFIHGSTQDKKRLQLLGQFQNSSVVNTLLISKVGDIAIDLPEANVIIQVSSHYGSRRQEAQRLGRILRAKPNSNPKDFNAFFYTLIVPDTEEQYYANRRQRYLVDQGYAFKVVENLLDIAENAGLKSSGALANLYDQQALLAKVLVAFEQKEASSTKTAPSTLVESQASSTAVQQPALPVARRVERATLASLSAAAGSTTYSEFDKKM